MIDRLTVLCMNAPYPPNEGGKADVWRRMAALCRSGVKLQLVHWVQGQEGSQEIPAALREVAASVVRFRARRTVANTPPWDLIRVPFHATKYRLSDRDQSIALEAIREFQPDALLVEGVWVSEVGRTLARQSGLPYLYRSHNIEHLYMPRQAMAATTWKGRWSLRASNLHLERFEFAALQGATRVFDISHEEMLWWKRRGLENVEWLPPVAEAALREPPPRSAKDLDVLFLGNLFAPNNVGGVLWMLDEVWPLVLAERPTAQLTVAGSNPIPMLRRRIEDAKCVQLIADVGDPLELLVRAKVLVNPVLFGSGVQLKTVDMLAVAGDLVSTPQGVAGLPDWLKTELSPVERPDAFARAILDRLDGTRSVDPRVDRMSQFSADVVQVLRRALEGRGGSA